LLVNYCFVCLQESRTGRVDSWRQFSTQKKSHKKMKGTFRPPKPKLEKR